MECVEKLIKKDMLHPLTNAKLKEKDIIPLQRVIAIVQIQIYIMSCIWNVYVIQIYYVIS